MTITVTMLDTRMGEDSTLWTAGTEHEATETFAKHLVQFGWATATFSDVTAATTARGRVTAAGEFEFLDHTGAVIGGATALAAIIAEYEAGTLADTAATVPQFALTQRALPVTTRNAAVTQLLEYGPCALVGVRCIAPGSSGTLTIHDDINASTAAKLRFSLAFGSATANTYYPAVADEPCGMLFDRGCFVTVPAAGVYAIDLLVGSAITGVDGTGLLTVATRVTDADNPEALIGSSQVVSIKVIAPGSAGNLVVYNAFSAVAAETRVASTAYTSLAANQIIRLGQRGAPMQFDSLYVTVPTAAIILINHLPR